MSLAQSPSVSDKSYAPKIQNAASGHNWNGPGSPISLPRLNATESRTIMPPPKNASRLVAKSPRMNC